MERVFRARTHSEASQSFFGVLYAVMTCSAWKGWRSHWGYSHWKILFQPTACLIFQGVHYKGWLWSQRCVVVWAIFSILFGSLQISSRANHCHQGDHFGDLYEIQAMMFRTSMCRLRRSDHTLCVLCSVELPLTKRVTTVSLICKISFIRICAGRWLFTCSREVLYVAYSSVTDDFQPVTLAACRRRTLVAIGTHDLDTLEGPFTYEVRSVSRFVVVAT